MMGATPSPIDILMGLIICAIATLGGLVIMAAAYEVAYWMTVTLVKAWL